MHIFMSLINYVMHVLFTYKNSFSFLKRYRSVPNANKNQSEKVTTMNLHVFIKTTPVDNRLSSLSSPVFVGEGGGGAHFLNSGW